MGNAPICYYRSDLMAGALRSRSVGRSVLSAQVALPPPPERLLADWRRETTQRLQLEPGDVDVLPLARACMRWPDYACCVQAAADWTRTLGLAQVLAGSELALMACRGTRYHHDAAQYGGAVFCNLFLSEDRGLELHFPASAQRIPLTRGTVVLFDTAQPHAVIARGSDGFQDHDFAPELDRTPVFLTWELPVEHAAVSALLHIAFDVGRARAMQLADEQVQVHDVRVAVCAQSGGWRAPDAT